eukprot:COSAG01_NODE_13125_length_1632_cov_1.497065_1_plen_544_part_11
MEVAWTAPASGTTPTGYIVYRDDGDSATPSIVVFEGDALTATASRLTGGTSYSFMVAALSAAGVGDVSGVSAQSTSPAAPLGLSSVTQTSTSISLSWSASVVGAGGSAVTSYKVYRNDGSSATAALSSTAAHTTADGSTTTATVSDLSAGLLYSFAVSAVSAAGEGDQSSILAQSSSPGAPASGPTSLHQTSTSISLDWSAPASDGLSGEDASGYRLYNVAGTPAVLLYAGAETAYEQVDLSASTLYEYAVSAVSDAGESPPTSTLVQSTAPGAPTGLSSSGWSTSGFDVTWVAPTVGGGAALTGYTLYERVTYEMADVAASSGVPSSALQTMLSEDTDTVVVDTVAYDGSSSTAVSTSLSGLIGGVSYDYVVAARSDAGEGERSAALSVSTSPPAPGSLDSVSQTTSSITLSWSAPLVTTGSAVTGYNVYIDDGSSGTPGDVPVSCGGGGDALSTTCTASGLTGGVSYSFQVSALSTTGESDRSSVLAQSTAPAAVDAASMTFSSVTTTSMDVAWTAPASGTTPTGYIVYRDDGDSATPSIVV